MEEPSSILAEDVEIVGSLKCTGALRSAGKINGDVVCGSDVLIEKTAALTGNLTASSVVVLGQVKGNITVKDRVELKANARVVGDIRGKRLTVEDGVGLAGKIEIGALQDAGEAEAAEPVAGAAAAETAAETGRVEEEAATRPHRAVGRDEARLRSASLFTRK
jgi:cytoskeletal protein CcmA (bactofilin family)